MQDYEPVNHFLGVGYEQDLKAGTVRMDQRGAVEALLQELQIKNRCHRRVPLPPNVKILPQEGSSTEEFRKHYQSEVAKATCLQACDPSICQAVSKHASVASNPSKEHMRLLDDCLLPFLGKNLDDSGIKFSRSVAWNGRPEDDPAVAMDGSIKPGCSLHHFKPRLFVDANFVDDTTDSKRVGEACWSSCAVDQSKSKARNSH